MSLIVEKFQVDYPAGRKIKRASPAKCNLTLAITARRADGYHTLESVIVPLSLSDEVEISCLQRNGSGLPKVINSNSARLEQHVRVQSETDPGVQNILQQLSSPDNLAARAAISVLERLGIAESFEVEIAIEKRVPFGAGLGGGSGNAAAVFSGLNEILGCPLSHEELLTLAAQLGSDIPAMLSAQAVFVYGCGEKLLKLEPDPETRASLEQIGVLILKPPISVPTAEAYQKLAIPLGRVESNSPDKASIESTLASLGFSTRDSLLDDTKPRKTLTFAERNGNTERLNRGMVTHELVRHFSNDFEMAIYEHYPLVKTARDFLQKQGLGERGVLRAMLAGSGSAVIGFTESQTDAQRIEQALAETIPKGWFVASAKMLL